MTTARTPFTRADYDRLPEGFPCELIEGELVKEPAPVYRHQRVVLSLARTLIEQVGIERVVCSPIDVVLDDVNVLQPDVAVFSAPLSADVERVPVPALVIEVLSPSTERRDRVRKTRVYLGHGVCEVWLVDPQGGAIEVCAPAGRTVHGPDASVGSAAVPEVVLRGGDLVM